MNMKSSSYFFKFRTFRKVERIIASTFLNCSLTWRFLRVPMPNFSSVRWNISWRQPPCAKQDIALVFDLCFPKKPAESLQCRLINLRPSLCLSSVCDDFGGCQNSLRRQGRHGVWFLRLVRIVSYHLKKSSLVRGVLLVLLLCTYLNFQEYSLLENCRCLFKSSLF